jgi:amino acid transporter
MSTGTYLASSGSSHTVPWWIIAVELAIAVVLLGFAVYGARRRGGPPQWLRTLNRHSAWLSLAMIGLTVALGVIYKDVGFAFLGIFFLGHNLATSPRRRWNRKWSQETPDLKPLIQD